MSEHETGGRAPVILVGGYTHELNSFVGGRTTLADMAKVGHHLEGAAMFSSVIGTGQELNAILDGAQAQGVELVPSIHVWGGVGPILDAETYAYIKATILAAVDAHIDRLDGVLLTLHGATACIGIEDTEGDLIGAVRDRVGPSIPIVASFDFHAHCTDNMVTLADGLFGEQTCPHVDYYETGKRAFDALIGHIRGDIRLAMRHRKIRMITSPERHDTNEAPMSEVMAAAFDAERTPGVISVTVFATQPWMDVSDLGWSVCVVTDDNEVLAQEVADSVASVAWERREQFRVRKVPVEEAVRQGLAAPAAPVILADGSDTTTGGGNGDGNQIIAELLRQGVTARAMATLVDSAAVAECFGSAISSQVDLEVGGRLTSGFSPLRVTGTLVTLADGHYMMEYPVRPRDVGRIAVIEVGAISIVLTEGKPSHLDEGIYRRAGLNPRTAQMVVVKSAGGYRYGYAEIAAETIEVATQGPCNSELTELPYTHISRPLWPFDPDLLDGWAHENARSGETTLGRDA